MWGILPESITSHGVDCVSMQGFPSKIFCVDLLFLAGTYMFRWGRGVFIRTGQVLDDCEQTSLAGPSPSTWL